MSTLDDIAARGNRHNTAGVRWPGSFVVTDNNWIECANGLRISVVAGPGTYCSPRPQLAPGMDLIGEAPAHYRGPYTHVEVGFPSVRPQPWELLEPYCEDPAEPTNTVYSYVPVEVVRELIDANGGEAPTDPAQRDLGHVAR